MVGILLAMPFDPLRKKELWLTPHCPKKNRKKKLFTRYRLTVEDYEQMAADQGGVCAICRKAPTKRALAVDHDHITGKVRGLLCSPCNMGLGSFRDEPVLLATAMQYLQTHS